LTKKQQAVLARVAEGWSNQEIADGLASSENAVKAILQQLLKKYKVRKRASLVRLAVEQGHLTPSPVASHLASSDPTGHTLRSELPIAVPYRAGTEQEGPYAQIGHFKLDAGRRRTWVRETEGHTPWRIAAS
jgi:DNA-binding CsgD family transcriptional regulator